MATFAPRCYDSGEDSELGDLRSAERASAPSTTEPEDEGGRKDGLAWYDSKAEEEHKLIQKAHAEIGSERQKSQLAESLGKVRSEAEKAAGIVLQVAAGQGAQLAGAGVEKRKEAGGGEENGLAEPAVPRVLAIMDATDQPVPGSGDSGCEPIEPKQKRRGREVEVVGGSTVQDVQMEKDSGERGKGVGGGSGGSGEVLGE